MSQTLPTLSLQITASLSVYNENCVNMADRSTNTQRVQTQHRDGECTLGVQPSAGITKGRGSVLRCPLAGLRWPTSDGRCGRGPPPLSQRLSRYRLSAVTPGLLVTPGACLNGAPHQTTTLSHVVLPLENTGTGTLTGHPYRLIAT